MTSERLIKIIAFPNEQVSDRSSGKDESMIIKRLKLIRSMQRDGLTVKQIKLGLWLYDARGEAAVAEYRRKIAERNLQSVWQTAEAYTR